MVCVKKLGFAFLLLLSIVFAQNVVHNNFKVTSVVVKELDPITPLVITEEVDTYQWLSGGWGYINVTNLDNVQNHRKINLSLLFPEGVGITVTQEWKNISHTINVENCTTTCDEKLVNGTTYKENYSTTCNPYSYKSYYPDWKNTKMFLIEGKSETVKTESIQIGKLESKLFRFYANVPMWSSGKFNISIYEGLTETILDPWWNSSWTYRTPYVITENSGVALRNHPINLTIDTRALIAAGKLNSTCSDIRFGNETAENSYFNMTCNSTKAEIWVQIPYIAGSGTATIYMYYGNPLAGSGVPDKNIFSFYDDFTSATLDLTKWRNTSGCNGQFNQYNGLLNFFGSSGSWNCMFATHKNFTRPFIYEVDMITNDTNFLGGSCVHDNSTGTAVNYQACIYWLFWEGNANRFAIYEDGTGRLNTAFDFATSAWTTNTFRVMATGANYTVNKTSGAASTWLYNSSYSSEDNIKVGFNPRAKSQYDNAMVRAWANPEPTYVAGSEETETTPVVNTSMLGISFNTTNFVFSSSTYVEAFSFNFPATTANITFIVMSSMNIIKNTGGGTSQVWLNITLDGDEILEEKLRTVTKVAGVNDEGSTGSRPLKFNVTAANHTLKFFFRRTGNGAIEINDLDVLLLQFFTDHDKSVRGEIIDTNFTHGSTSYIDAFNITIDRAQNSTTFFAAKLTLEANQTSTGTYRLDNLVDDKVSPFVQRFLEDATDTGSISVSYIDTSGFTNDNHSISAIASDGTITVNGTTINFDMKDSDGNVLRNFQVTNVSTNATGANFTAGTHLLINQSVTVRNGTGYFIAMTASFKSHSGTQTPVLFVNTSEVAEANCYSKKERYLSGDTDIGNAYLWTICDPLAVGSSYTFFLWMTVATGETVELIDESMSGFEITDFDITTENVAPLVAITDPNTGLNKTGTFNINVSITDPNDDLFTFNLTIGATAVATKQPNEITTVSFDSTAVVDGLYTLTLRACENETAVKLCGSSTIQLRVDNNAPSNITALNFTRAETSLFLNWTDSSDGAGIGLSHYVIERDGVNIINASVSQYNDFPLTHSTTYAYNITPVDLLNQTGSPYNFTASTLFPVPGGNGGGGGGAPTLVELDEEGEVIVDVVEEKHPFMVFLEDFWAKLDLFFRSTTANIPNIILVLAFTGSVGYLGYAGKERYGLWMLGITGVLSIIYFSWVIAYIQNLA